MLIQPPHGRRRSSPSPPAQEERVGERRPVLLNAPLPAPTAVELRSADFSPTRAGSPKTAESGLKSALQAPCASVISTAVLPAPLRSFLARRGRKFLVGVSRCARMILQAPFLPGLAR